MEEMAICIDIAKCTACRSCQVACKNWNQLKGEQTENRGTHENPPDLSANTWNRIMFIDTKRPDGIMDRSFFNTRCRHCNPPPCEEAGEDVPDSIIWDDTGAVVYTEKTAELDFETVLSYCPYNIPRKNAETGRIVKCTMCIDRITNGLKPACVTACSTGALNFGTKKEMLAYANKRIQQLGGNANLYPGEDYNTLWVLPESPDTYSLAKAVPRPDAQYRLARRRSSYGSGIMAGAVLAAGAVNFIAQRRQEVAEAERSDRD